MGFLKSHIILVGQPRYMIVRQRQEHLPGVTERGRTRGDPEAAQAGAGDGAGSVTAPWAGSARLRAGSGAPLDPPLPAEPSSYECTGLFTLREVP